MEIYDTLESARSAWKLSGGWLLSDGSKWWVIATKADAIEMGWSEEYLDSLSGHTDAPLETVPA